AKDMASDYYPAQRYAERRGITFRERVAEIVRKVVPERLRNMFDGRRPAADGAPDSDAMRRPEREPEREEVRSESATPAREIAEDGQAALRKARTDALVRHARAVDAIFNDEGAGNEARLSRELADARKAFDEVRPHGWRDAEAAYVKNPALAREAGGGQVNRAIRALQLETEIRTDPSRRADRFVERWHKLDRTSQHQYRAGDMSGYKATRSAMGDMAKSLERDPQLESLLANRKGDLGIALESGRRLGLELAFNHGIDLGRGRGVGL
ncbi:MAG: Ti-type conjugative transfer relaxase TraA, partial [Mesorhizobium sp.]